MTPFDKIFKSENHEYTIQKAPVTNTQPLYWNVDLGIGYVPKELDDNTVYGQDYWDSYRALINTDMGKNLTKARVDIANDFNAKRDFTLDVGIGNGQFVDTFNCYGYDVNEVAVDYLIKNKKFVNPNNGAYVWQYMTMWDVIEHIDDATDILRKTDGVILSTPIYNDMLGCIKSKHLKPNEHIWYFTVSGMIHYMEMFGFKCLYYSTVESKLGRESIGSFVFKR
jgi:hypothetical protein